MKLLRPILSVALAMLVLFSATRFSVGLHYCSGDLQHIAFFDKAPACDKEENLPPCHQQQPKSCCEDTVVTHATQETLQPPVIHHGVGPDLLSDLTYAEVVVAEIIPAAPARDAGYTHHSPPLPSADLTIINQVFLI